MASGFLIGIPVVFTVDSWWLGDQTGPLEALVLLALAYALTLAAVYWIGFRRGLRHGWEYFADALEALAIAILALFVVFWSLGQIGNGQPTSIAVGRIAVAVTPVALGVAIANHLLPREGSRADPDKGDAMALRLGRVKRGERQAMVEVAASLAGALFLCLAIVPTDDLSAIATKVPIGHVPVVIALSLAVSYCVVFAAGFSGQRRRRASSGPFQDPIAETVIAYLAALAVAFLILRLFGRLDADSSPLVSFTKTVLLAFPASMAAAAGRLAV
jgi:putative integral membrane protein (TIGR02587 family)